MTDQKLTYRISGKTYTAEELNVYAKGKVKSPATPIWEKDVHRFILDWLSPLELLQVQTSGSTGLPKTIEFPKEFIEASAQASISYLNLKEGGIAYLCLPTQFIAGKLMVVRSMIGGMDLHFSEPSSLPDLGKLDEVEFAGMIPLQVARMLSTVKGRENLAKIKNLIIGGSFVPTNLEEKLKLLPNKIWSTYGMTETITHIALRRLNGEEASDWYTPLPTVKVKLDDRGCAVIDAEYIEVEGLISNDLAQIDTSGRFKILGRIDNAINSGGLLLHPEIVEKKLYEFIENDFFLAGLHDNELGERLVLFIEDPEEKLESHEDNLWKIINERLSGYEVPKSIVYIEEFERSANGKILRPNTVDEYVSRFNESDEED